MVDTRTVREVGVIRRLSIKLTVGAAIILVALAFIVLHLAAPDIQPLLEFAGAILGGGGILYAAYYAGLALHMQVDRDRLNRSFEIVQELNEYDRAELRVFIWNDLAGELTPQQVYERIVSDTACLSRVLSILGYFEDVSIAIQEGYADERVLYRSLSYLGPFFFSALQPFIYQRRDVTDNPDLNLEYERLVTAWRDGRFLSTSERIPPEVRMRGSGRTRGPQPGRHDPSGAPTVAGELPQRP